MAVVDAALAIRLAGDCRICSFSAPSSVCIQPRMQTQPPDVSLCCARWVGVGVEVREQRFAIVRYHRKNRPLTRPTVQRTKALCTTRIMRCPTRTTLLPASNSMLLVHSAVRTACR